MAIEGDGSTIYLYASGAGPVFGSGVPCTLVSWFWADTANTLMMLSSCTSAEINNNRNTLLVTASGANVQVTAASRDTGNALAMAAPTLATGAWHHGAAVFASDSSRIAYANGTASAENTTTKTLSTIDTVVTLGRAITGSQAFDGRVAEQAIYNAALRPTEIRELSLYRKCPLLVRPENLVWYRSYRSPLDFNWLPDYDESTTGNILRAPMVAAASPTYQQHPENIVYPDWGPVPYGFVAAAGGVVTRAGLHEIESGAAGTFRQGLQPIGAGL